VLREVLSWSFPIFQVFGIVVRVHFILPIVALSVISRAWLGKDSAGQEFPAGTWQDAASLMVLLFLSVLLHEFGHCFAARYMDGDSDEILLWPLGGLAFARSLPHTPSAHFVFALGGPLATFLLCVMSGVVLYLGFDVAPPLNPLWYPYRATHDSVAVYAWSWLDQAPLENRLYVILLMRYFWINWLLFIFNMLIGHPFDGGKMLQAALWPRFGHYQSSKIAIYAGFVMAVGVGIFAIVRSDMLIGFLSVFIFVSCAQEWMALEAAQEESLFGYDFSQGYTSLERDEPPAPAKPKKQNFIQRWLAARAARKLQEEQEQREADDRRMDELLEKIQKFGKSSLTDEENRFLKRVADRYKNKH
jgi:Zn-dependent protease